METTYRYEQASISKRLVNHPHEFEFYQAVRVLKRLIANQPASRLDLKVAPSLVFPDRQVTAITLHNAAELIIWTCETPMLGLIGPMGVLPPHYTEQILNQMRHRETQFRDFFSLFEQRSLELLYQVWQKHRSYVQLEAKPYQDPFTRGLQCLTGTEGLSQQTKAVLPLNSICYFAGIFSRPIRSAEGLRLLLQGYFHVEITVREYIGRWLQVASDQYSHLPDSIESHGKNNRLGQTAALGTRSWECHSQIEIVVGSLSFEQYSSFLPTQAQYQKLRFLAQLYLGFEFSINIRLVLAAAAFQAGRVGEALLGLTAWITEDSVTSNKDDVLLIGD